MLRKKESLRGPMPILIYESAYYYDLPIFRKIKPVTAPSRQRDVAGLRSNFTGVLYDNSGFFFIYLIGSFRMRVYDLSPGRADFTDTREL